MAPSQAVLIEEIGMHFETMYGIPPLAARIYATLVLSTRDGKSFEELTEQMGASKSSMSTSINLLLQLDKIEYYTKPGDRKRYFRKKANYLKMRLENYIKIIDREMVLFDKTFDYLKENNPSAFEEGAPIKEVYHDYLEKSKQLMQDTIHKLDKNIEKKH